MAFTYRWLNENDISATANRLSKEASEQFARLQGSDERTELAKTIWGELQALGWPYLMIAEARGGLGGDLLDLAAILEGTARNALPLPLLAAFGIAPLLVNAAGDAGVALAAQIVDGDVIILPAIEGVAMRSRGKVGRVTYRQNGEQIGLEGRLLGVEAVPSATHILLAAHNADGADDATALILYPLDVPGLTTAPAKRMDGRASLDLAFDQLTLPSTALLTQGDAVHQTVDRIADLGALLTCVEVVAAMGTLIAETIDYLTVRKQFDVALGSFQALRHYVADMVAAYEITHALLQTTLKQFARQPDQTHAEAISLLSIRVSSAGGLIARQAIQLHGGMGMTDALLATRLARRIMMAEFEYGDAAFHLDRLMTLRGYSQ